MFIVVWRDEDENLDVCAFNDLAAANKWLVKQAGKAGFKVAEIGELKELECLRDIVGDIFVGNLGGEFRPIE